MDGNGSNIPTSPDLSTTAAATAAAAAPSSQRPLVHFVDFDQPAEFQKLEQWSSQLSARNFVLDFDNAIARCAHDIDAAGMGEVLENRASLKAAVATAAATNSNNNNNNRSPPLNSQQFFSSATASRKLGTRWINVWRPEEQKALLQRVGRHYGFSARLVGSMCCAHAAVREPTEQARHEHRTMGELMNEFMQPWRSSNNSKNRRRTSPTAARKQAAAMTRRISREEEEEERGQDGMEGGGGEESSTFSRGVGVGAAGMDDGDSVRTGFSSSVDGGEYGNGNGKNGNGGTGGGGGGGSFFDLGHYQLVDDVWHFSSVDWGQRYLCIGFNSLYRVDREIDVDSYKPAGKRVWTWLVLCDDGTVIAIHENPYPGLDAARLTRHQQRTVLAIRRNLRNVFKQLSRGFNDTRLQNMLEVVKLRSGLSAGQHGGNGGGGGGGTGGNGNDLTTLPPNLAEEDTPSLLFYYLFDDWFTSYSLVARREHQYGVELDGLRDRMFHRAELEHVSRLHHYSRQLARLHHYGRQLAVLKRIYTSYSTIIQRILDGPQAHAQTAHTAGGAALAAAGGGVMPAAMQDSSDLVERSTVIEVGDPSPYGVEIAVAASTRFRRLRDRINMYAIGEIQDCIEEKNSLMELNFNLITLKESSYIEGLTRITILLAKVTILFIPISFITAYFTVEFTDANDEPVKYNVQQYWATFAVVLFLTVCGLGLFGRLSGTQEGKPIYESFTSVFIKGWRSLWRKRGVADEHEQQGDIKLQALKT